MDQNNNDAASTVDREIIATQAFDAPHEFV